MYQFVIGAALGFAAGCLVGAARRRSGRTTRRRWRPASRGDEPWTSAEAPEEWGMSYRPAGPDRSNPHPGKTVAPTIEERVASPAASGSIAVGTEVDGVTP